MTNSLPQRAEALRGEARRALLAVRDQLTTATAINDKEELKSYIALRDTRIKEAVGILPTSEIADLTGVTRQRIQQITATIASDAVAAFHARFTPQAVREQQNAIIRDAMDEKAVTRQAELELTTAYAQFREDKDSGSDNLAILMRVATNIIRDQALPISRITEITHWSKADLHRMAYGADPFTLPPTPAKSRIPEADV